MRCAYHESVEAKSQERTGERIAQKQRTRGRLLEAGAQLLSAGATPTLDDVASAAGISRATAYRYFGTENLLVVEVALTNALGAIDGPLNEVREICSTIHDHEDRVEAVVRCMGQWAWDHQSALRITMAHSLDGGYQRPGHRAEWIDLTLAPALPELTSDAASQLRRALFLLFGLDPLLSLNDLLHLDRAEALNTLAHTARALTQAALRTSLRPERRDDPPAQ